MKRCKLCGNQFRKGVLAFHKDGSRLKGGIVCQSCANGGVLLVAAEPVKISDGGNFRGKLEGLEAAIALLEGGRT